jgi:hypothetical protein
VATGSKKSPGGGTATAFPAQRGARKNRPQALELAPLPTEDAALEVAHGPSTSPRPPVLRATKPHAATNAWNSAKTGRAMLAYIHAQHDKVAVNVGYHGKRRKHAITLQCLVRCFQARKRHRLLLEERERDRLKVSERAAKALMARIPSEAPDHSAARQWLKDGNAPSRHVGRLEASTRCVSPGAVDLSRTGRGAFWLGQSANAAHDAIVSPGLRAAGGQVRRTGGQGAAGSSVRSMINFGLGPYYSPFTT